MRISQSLSIFLAFLVSFSLSIFLSSCSEGSPFEEENAIEVFSGEDYDLIAANNEFLTGNGTPSGPHFNLNIIGVPKSKTADMTGDEGHRIFVNLEGNTKISLEKSEDFGVLDANGTDARAGFALPHPDPNEDGVTLYSVYARSLGTPGGSATIATCATYTYLDPDTGEEITEEVCSSKKLIVIRDKGRSKFSDVSDQLLSIYADLDGDGTEEEYSLFDDALEDYLWSYDNKGLKLLQLRFYYN